MGAICEIYSRKPFAFQTELPLLRGSFTKEVPYVSRQSGMLDYMVKTRTHGTLTNLCHKFGNCFLRRYPARPHLRVGAGSPPLQRRSRREPVPTDMGAEQAEALVSPMPQGRSPSQPKVNGNRPRIRVTSRRGWKKGDKPQIQASEGGRRSVPHPSLNLRDHLAGSPEHLGGVLQLGHGRQPQVPSSETLSGHALAPHRGVRRRRSQRSSRRVSTATAKQPPPEAAYAPPRATPCRPPA